MTRRVYAKLLLGRLGAHEKACLALNLNFPPSILIQKSLPSRSERAQRFQSASEQKTLISTEVIYPVQTNLTVFLAERDWRWAVEGSLSNPREHFDRMKNEFNYFARTFTFFSRCVPLVLASKFLSLLPHHIISRLSYIMPHVTELYGVSLT
jgi:hypothetical protein